MDPISQKSLTFNHRDRISTHSTEQHRQRLYKAIFKTSLSSDIVCHLLHCTDLSFVWSNSSNFTCNHWYNWYAISLMHCNIAGLLPTRDRAYILLVYIYVRDISKEHHNHELWSMFQFLFFYTLAPVQYGTASQHICMYILGQEDLLLLVCKIRFARYLEWHIVRQYQQR